MLLGCAVMVEILLAQFDLNTTILKAQIITNRLLEHDSEFTAELHHGCALGKLAAT